MAAARPTHRKLILALTAAASALLSASLHAQPLDRLFFSGIFNRALTCDADGDPVPNWDGD